LGWVSFFVIVNLSARFFFGVSFFLMGWVGLDRVTQNGPMDDSVLLRFFDARTAAVINQYTDGSDRSQVKLCDLSRPIWHESSRSGVAMSRCDPCTLFYFIL